MNRPARTAAALAYCVAGGSAATLAGTLVASELGGTQAWTACLAVSAVVTGLFAALATRWNPPRNQPAAPAMSAEERDFRESLALGFTEDLDAFTRRLDETTRKDT